MFLRGRVPEVVGWLALVSLVVGFVFKLAPTFIAVMAAIIVLCGIAVREPLRALSLLPGTALLGPIAMVSLPGGFVVHLGDIYLAAIGLTFLAREGSGFPLRSGRSGGLILVLGCCVLLSWLFSLDVVAVLPTVVGIIELVLVYLLTQYAAKHSGDARYLLNSWLFAVTLASCLVIVSYLRGDVLILGAAEEARTNAFIARTSETLLFRASFFVTSFIFPLAAAVAVSAAKLMFEKPTNPARRVLVLMLIANSGAIIAMGNATAAIGAVCGILSLVLFLPWIREARTRFISGMGGLVTAGVVLVILLRQVLPSSQIALLVGRGSDTTSLEARLFVWRNVFQYLLDSPHALYLGLGPDISIRLVDTPLLQSLFFGGGLQQAAVDSGYLYLVLNYGIFALIAALLIGGRSMYLLFESGARGNVVSVLLWTVMVVWAIMSITQQHGISKPVFMIVQILALTEVSTWRRRTSDPFDDRSQHPRDQHVDLNAIEPVVTGGLYR